MVGEMKTNMEAMPMLTAMRDQAMRIKILTRKVLRRDSKDKMTSSCLRKFSCLGFPKVKILKSLLFPNKPRLLFRRAIRFIDGGLSLILSLSYTNYPMLPKRISWACSAGNKSK